MNLTRSGIALAAALALGALLCMSGCNKGLAPLNEPSGISGTIHFLNWPNPPPYELRLVAFPAYPSDSASLLNALLVGNVAVYPPFGVPNFYKGAKLDTIQYSITTSGTLLQVRPYAYVALAWRYGPGLFTDWRPAGVYTLSGDKTQPSTVRVLLHKIQPGIDIYVDFNNPPPRPWR